MTKKKDKKGGKRMKKKELTELLVSYFRKQWKKFIRPRRWRRTDFYCRTQFGSCDEQR